MPTSRRARPFAAALLLAGVGGACSRGESRPVHAAGTAEAGRPTDRSLARGDRVALAGDVVPPDVRPTRPAYRTVAVADAGSVTGTVVLDGPAPADTTVTPVEADRRACGNSYTDRAVDRDGTGGVRGAVVWLEGVAAGKAMPWARRYELALDGCQLAPRLLPVAVGGTLDVHGVDPLETRLRFVRAAAEAAGTATAGTAGAPAPAGAVPVGAADTGRVLLRTTMTAAGQVVPDERVLAQAGGVEVREETRPWIRGWVLAFDQPYFAATGAGGAFTLADVPPGSYRLVAWHDRLGRVVTPVTVSAGAAATVTVHLRASGAAAAPAATTTAGR